MQIDIDFEERGLLDLLLRRSEQTLPPYLMGLAVRLRQRLDEAGCERAQADFDDGSDEVEEDLSESSAAGEENESTPYTPPDWWALMMGALK